MPDTPLVRLTEKPPRLGLAVLARCLALGRGDLMAASALCEAKFPDAKAVGQILKSAVASGSLSDADWARPLWAYQTVQTEFVAAMRPSSILGRLSGVRRVPFSMRVPRTTQSATLGWVADAAPKPVSELRLDEITLGRAKAAGIVIVSQELARSSEPSAEASIAQDMIAAANSFVDAQFVSPSNVAVVDAHPGSILSGITPITSAGSTAANIVTDLTAAVDAVLAGGGQLAQPVWIMHPKTAVRLALKRDSQGSPAFPDITFSGGVLAGVPVLTSTNVPISTSGGTIIALVDQAEVLLADDGQVSIDVSSEAAIQMDSAPSSSASQQTSLWQSNLIGIRIERAVNWAPRRSAAAVASYIDSVSY